MTEKVKQSILGKRGKMAKPCGERDHEAVVSYGYEVRFAYKYRLIIADFGPKSERPALLAIPSLAAFRYTGSNIVLTPSPMEELIKKLQDLQKALNVGKDSL